MSDVVGLYGGLRAIPGMRLAQGYGPEIDIAEYGYRLWIPCLGC